MRVGVYETKTLINTLWANSHASSFDGKVWLYDYVSELYDSYSHIFPSCAVPAPLPSGR